MKRSMVPCRPRTARTGRWKTALDFLRTYPYLLPAIIFFLGWQLLPIYDALRISFTDDKFLDQAAPNWIGLQNYRDVLHDPLFWEGIKRAFIFTLIFVPGVILIPMAAAVCLDRVRSNKLSTAYRADSNVRLGDPETQVILSLVDEPMLPLLVAAAEGRLRQPSCRLGRDKLVGVVIASRGYPESSDPGRLIRGTEDAATVAQVFHAGTAQQDGVARYRRWSGADRRRARRQLRRRDRPCLRRRVEDSLRRDAVSAGHRTKSTLLKPNHHGGHEDTRTSCRSDLRVLRGGELT